MSVKEQNNDTENYVDTSMAPRKNRQNDRQTICLLYASSVVAASLSIAVASMQYAEVDQQTNTAKWGRPLFSSSLYATCCLLLVIMAGYFEFHRRETFEAVYRGTGPVPFSVKFSVKGEKVNLYLRLGLAMFGLMSIGHVAVKCVEEAEITDAVFNLYLKSILEMAFYVLQTLFILRYHRLVILQYNEVMGAFLVHLLTTNLCIWADISVGKIDKTLWYGNQKKTNDYMYNHTYGNGNESHYHHLKLINGNEMNNLTLLDNRTHLYNLVDISFYLLPTVSEYCLLAAALLYEIVMRIGQPTFIEIERPHDSKKDHTVLRDCRGWSTSSGAWFGIITVLIIIALTTLTVSAPNHIDLKQNLWKCIVVLAEEAVLSLFGILFVLMAFYQTRRLKFSIATRQSRVDEFLLYTAFFFAANYTITTIILAADLEAKGSGISNTNSSEKHLLIGRCLVNAFEFIQMVLQTYFVQDSFYRCSDRIEQQIVKPGRQSIVALLGINLALWIQKSFQLKSADILFMLETNRGTYGWILFVVTMPISLFYRYHCTVCLSQCFNKLYEDETHRFEEMWRHQVDPFTDILVRSTDSFSEYEQAKTSLKHTSEVQVTIENDDRQNRKLAVFSKIKPWRTFDLTDETENDGKATLMGQNHHVHNKSQVNKSGYDENIPVGNSIQDDENYLKSNKQLSDSQTHTESQNQDYLRCDGDVSVHDDEDKFPKANKTTEIFPSDTSGVITQKNDDHLAKDRLSSARNSYTCLANRRYSLVILPSDQYSSKNEELNAVTIDSKTFDKNLQDHLSGVRQTPERRQVRRRRTLKNLETAKHRVLAAELAHRMVIERTSGASPTAYFVDANISNFENNNQCSLELKNSSSLISNRSSDAVENSPKLTCVQSSAHEFRIAKAVTETAAITIAPVESKIAANIPLITFNQYPDPINKESDISHKSHLSLLQFHHRRSAANINRVMDELKNEDEFQKRLQKRSSFKEGNWPSKIGFHKSFKNHFTKSSSPESNLAQKHSKPEHNLSNEKSKTCSIIITSDQTNDKNSVDLTLSSNSEVPIYDLKLTKGE
ncbi:unnamed protein product [Schistosoma margrebowiei]|uniref:Otopetrin n=1 Tax=Schistosoma margrebowiei TaxID=48269 RepID=A0AA84Z742_9TREM|nr:unnamed protein product [Schistosoma margrebowiei]